MSTGEQTSADNEGAECHDSDRLARGRSASSCMQKCATNRSTCDHVEPVRKQVGARERERDN
jgi:hypothetical protein